MHLIVRILLLCLVLLAARPVAASEVVDRIVGVVNGDVITMFELNAHLKPLLERFRGKQLSDEEKRAIAKMRQDILKKMIDDKLLVQEIEKLKLSTTDVEVQNAVDSFRKRSGLTEEDFEKQLILEGLSMDEFREKVRMDILKHRLIGFMVRRKVVVSDEEVREYFNAHRADYQVDKKVTLSAILTGNIVEAESLVKRLKAGEIAFDDAARLYSKGPGAEQGGSLGQLAWNEISPDWRDALTGLGVGDISEPFSFREFAVILKVDDLSGGGEADFDAVAGEIREKLYQEQAEARFDEYMEKLRSEAVIENKL